MTTFLDFYTLNLDKFKTIDAYTKKKITILYTRLNYKSFYNHSSEYKTLNTNIGEEYKDKQILSTTQHNTCSSHKAHNRKWISNMVDLIELL